MWNQGILTCTPMYSKSLAFSSSLYRATCWLAHVFSVQHIIAREDRNMGIIPHSVTAKKANSWCNAVWDTRVIVDWFYFFVPKDEMFSDRELSRTVFVRMLRLYTSFVGEDGVGLRVWGYIRVRRAGAPGWSDVRTLPEKLRGRW